MKNILITGSNGFIGKYLYTYFRDRNFNLIFATTSKTKLNNYYQFDNLYSNIKDILVNISIDIIIHVASIIPKSFNDSDFKLFMNNTQMINNLAEFAINRKIKKFIYLSSFGSMTNTLNYDIKDYYTLSKITGEHICSIMENAGIETASLRLTSPFGEFCKSTNVLSIFIKSALLNEDINVFGSGKREQNFIHTENIIDCIKRCIYNKIQGVYDLVGETNINMIDLANLIKRITNSKSKIIVGFYDDPLEKVKLCNFSLDRLKKELNYREIKPLEQGLVEYIDWKKKIYENSFYL